MLKFRIFSGPICACKIFIREAKEALSLAWTLISGARGARVGIILIATINASVTCVRIDRSSRLSSQSRSSRALNTPLHCGALSREREERTTIKGELRAAKRRERERELGPGNRERKSEPAVGWDARPVRPCARPSTLHSDSAKLRGTGGCAIDFPPGVARQPRERALSLFCIPTAPIMHAASRSYKCCCCLLLLHGYRATRCLQICARVHAGDVQGTAAANRS